MKKILQVFASLNMGGAESRMMDVYRKIDREKYIFDFLCMQQGEQYYEPEIRSAGGRIVKIDPPRVSGAYANFRTIRKVLRDGHYDAVHAHTSFHCGVVMLAAWLEKVPVRISHARTTGSKNNSLKNKTALVIGRAFISLFATVRLAVSKEAGNYIFGKKPFTVLPNAVDCEKYLLTPDDAAEQLKSRYGIDKEEICFGLVGRFANMKNHEFAVDVFYRYNICNPKSRLIFVGDGELRKSIEEKVERLGISNKVIFAGMQSNVNEWMRLFDVLLVPSLFEGFPGVMLEAQASGTPVIKSDLFTNEPDIGIGLVQEVSVTNGTDGWLDCIEKALKTSLPDKEKIRSSFIKRGYTLTGEINILQVIYQGRRYENPDSDHNDI